MAESSDQTVYAWGWANVGQLGLTYASESVANPVATVKNVAHERIQQVSAGLTHTALLTDTGTVYTSGKGKFGRLGHGDERDRRVVERIYFFSDNQQRVTFVSCGHYHTACITAKGDLFTFGRNDSGQLGLGHKTNVYIPIKVESELFKGRKVIQVACGSSHTLLYNDKNEIFTFGDGQFGELGIGDTGHSLHPVRVDAPEFAGLRITSISAGFSYSAAVLQGIVFTWGKNHVGQCGVGHTDNCLIPTAVVGLKGHNVIQVTCGYSHTGCLTDLGHVFTWGSGSNGELGTLADFDIHPKSKQTEPVRVKEALFKKHVSYISFGNYHSAALTTNGELYIWGLNDYGQLGNGHTNSISAPWHVRGPLQKEIIGFLSLGGRHTIAATYFRPHISISESVIQSDFATYFNSPDFTDITIHIDNHDIKCHKVILSRSPVLRSQLAAVPSIKEYTIKDIRYGIFTIILKYLYTDKLEFDLLNQKEEEAIAVELLSAVQSLHLDHLKSTLEWKVAVGTDWQNLSDKIPSGIGFDLFSFVNNKEFSDISFLVEGQIFYGHKVILASRSPHFRGLFSNAFKESFEEQIEIEMKPSIFKTMLDYIYTDNVDIQEDDAVELMTVANEYSLHRLKTLCEEYVSRGVDIENVSWLFDICDKYDAQQLKAFCLYFLTKEFDKVSKTEAFQQLPESIVAEATKLRLPTNDSKSNKGGKDQGKCTIQ